MLPRDILYISTPPNPFSWVSESFKQEKFLLSKPFSRFQLGPFLSMGPRPSSETQGQIVRARESLNGRKNMARRKHKSFLAPIRRQSGGYRLELVW